MHGRNESAYVAAFGFCSGKAVLGGPSVPVNGVCQPLLCSGSMTAIAFRVAGSNYATIHPVRLLCHRPLVIIPIHPITIFLIHSCV